MARRSSASRAASCSARSDFRNLRRAGVAKNRSRTSTRVPNAPAAGAGDAARPASTSSAKACSWPRGRLMMRSRLTPASAASASPRKPSRVIRISSSSSSLEVAWRCTASASWSGAMPLPSSVTAISARPPPLSSTAIRVAPASIAFSTSSLTADAGRSITSPAAIRLTTPGGRGRMAGTGAPQGGADWRREACPAAGVQARCCPRHRAARADGRSSLPRP